MSNESAREYSYGELAVGDRADFTVTITEALVKTFADVSGDRNPLHMDEAYGAQTAFHKRVAHGMLVGSFFSRFVGMHLPGKYSLYLSQTLRFHAPISIGTAVTIRGVISQKTDAAQTITVQLTAEDASGKMLTSGEALVRLLK